MHWLHHFPILRSASQATVPHMTVWITNNELSNDTHLACIYKKNLIHLPEVRPKHFACQSIRYTDHYFCLYFFHYECLSFPLDVLPTSVVVLHLKLTLQLRMCRIGPFGLNKVNIVLSVENLSI